MSPDKNSKFPETIHKNIPEGTLAFRDVLSFYHAAHGALRFSKGTIASVFPSGTSTLSSVSICGLV